MAEALRLTLGGSQLSSNLCEPTPRQRWLRLFRQFLPVELLSGARAATRSKTRQVESRCRRGGVSDEAELSSAHVSKTAISRRT